MARFSRVCFERRPEDADRIFNELRVDFGFAPKSGSAQKLALDLINEFQAGTVEKHRLRTTLRAAGLNFRTMYPNKTPDIQIVEMPMRNASASVVMSSASWSGIGSPVAHRQGQIGCSKCATDRRAEPR